MLPALHGPWLPLIALVLVAVALRRDRRPTLADLGLLGALVVGAAVARLGCGVWGPLHVNGQGPLWIRGALDADALSAYGPGYFELLNWVTRLGAAPDTAIFAANAILSALSSALLYAVARLSGVARGGALAAALVLAADAVTLRTAATEGYFSPLIALVLSVQVGLALAVRADRRDDRTGAGLALIAAGLLAASAARVHPMSYLPLALCPLVVFGAAQADGRRARVGRTLVAGAVIGFAALVTSGDIIVTALGESDATEHAFGGLAGRDWQLLLAALVLVCGLHRWLEPPWLPLLGIASMALMLATQDGFQQHPLWQLCYQRLFLPGALLGAAPFLVRGLQRRALACAAAAAGVIALFVAARPHLGTFTTEQLEYRFLQDTLAGMPPGCVVAAVSRAEHRVWEIPGHLVASGGSPGSGARRALDGPSDLAGAVVADGCLLYVHSSLCSSAEGRPLCESVERNTRLEEVASRRLPAVPSYTTLPYDRPEVAVGVFRVRGSTPTATGRSPVVSDGAAITPALARALYDRLVALRESDGCRVTRLDTGRVRATVGIVTSGGVERTVEVATGATEGINRRAGRWTLAVAADLEHDCARTVAALGRVLADL